MLAGPLNVPFHACSSCPTPTASPDPPKHRTKLQRMVEAYCKSNQKDPVTHMFKLDGLELVSFLPPPLHPLDPGPYPSFWVGIAVAVNTGTAMAVDTYPNPLSGTKVNAMQTYSNAPPRALTVISFQPPSPFTPPPPPPMLHVLYGVACRTRT